MINRLALVKNTIRIGVALGHLAAMAETQVCRKTLHEM
jgi:hypothetical protein